MILMNKLTFLSLIFTVLLLTTSCGDKEDFPNPIAASSMNWLFQEEVGQRFTMVDDNGITEDFVLTQSVGRNSQNDYQANGLDIDLSKISYYSQQFSTTYSDVFSMGLRSGYGNYGDTFLLNIGGVSYDIDLHEALVTSVRYNSDYLSYSTTEDGYENNGNPLYSTVTFLENEIINGITYEKVMYIKYNDFIVTNTDFTIKEIYLAKGFGLVKYIRNNGIISHRI